jgi:2,4-dienoyl-CoA reductase-like NADH-dependent reductase (Old Yellow Enzyme family)
MNRTELLFEPFSEGNIQLPNRLVMAPMTREHAPGGIPGPENAAYYRRRVEAGVGLIITEGTWIDHPTAGDRDRVPNFFGEAALKGWQLVIDAVHAAGGKIYPQLWHIGMERRHGHQGVPSVGPSGLAYQAGEDRWSAIREPMTGDEIEGVITAYGAAAAAAQATGCDGIELHAAHGYLIDQFFWDRSNLRNDQYGGDLVRRTRFAADVVRECRRQTDASFPICLRFSQWKTSDYNAQLFSGPEQLAQFLEPLTDAGVDMFHCSTRRYWEAAFPDSPLTLPGWTRQLSGKPAIVVGSVGLDAVHQTWRIEKTQGYTSKPASLERLYDLMERQEVDLVAVGRALLADPEWASKVRRDAWDELIPYTTDLRYQFT